MPSKGPDGKPITGAEKVRRKKDAREHERKRVAGSATGFEDLPAAPIKGKTGTAGLVSWAAKALALTVERAIRSPDIFETERDKLRFIADGCAKIGMVRDKAAEQDRIKRALSKKKQASKEEGLTDVGGPAPQPIQRPPR